MFRSLLLLASVLAVGCASTPGRAPRASAERADFLMPDEIAKRLQASSVQYRVDGKDSPPGGWAEALWPLQVPPVPHPQRVVEDGQPHLRPWPPHPEARALLEEAEPLYQAERYAEAGKLYERATTLCPTCYMAWTFRGDAALFAGDATTALAHYREAARLNPEDAMLFFFQGHTLARLGRMEEAREALTWSLVLDPRNAQLRTFVQNNRELGLVLRGDVLVPRGWAHQDGDAVAVEFDPDYGIAWLAYANCKALWLGEPSHREEVTGEREHGFTTDEELECLTSAALVHEAQKLKGGEALTDASLDRLSAVLRDGMASELVLFELGARVYPQLVLTMEAPARQRLRAYVLKHVLVPVGSL